MCWAAFAILATKKNRRRWPREGAENHSVSWRVTASIAVLLWGLGLLVQAYVLRAHSTAALPQIVASGEVLQLGVLLMIFGVLGIVGCRKLGRRVSK